jgi:protein-tyrosine phosphatase
VRSIDLHAHVLPGVDDGPATMEDALALARAAVAEGTSQIVATPHVNEHDFIAPEDIPPAVAVLNQALAGDGIDLVVRSGAEIALPRLLDLEDDELPFLGLGGGPYLLLESPFAAVAGDFEPLVHDAFARGRLVVLAHPERCPTFQRHPDRLVGLVDAGVLVQVTAGALVGTYGSRVRDFALHLLREDLVHVVASDAHDAVRRPPGLRPALRAIERTVPGIADRAVWLTETVPAAILAGAAIPEPPPLRAHRLGWRRLLAARAH